MPKALLLSLLALILPLAAGCEILGTSSDEAVAVQLVEWEMTADPASTIAGAITFEVTNDGERTHDFAVLLPGEDPGDKYTIIGEMKDLEPEETRNLTVNLVSGTTYELASLRVSIEGGQVLSDYDQGLRLEFPVE